MNQKFSVFSKIGKDYLEEFVEICSKHVCIDSDKAYNLAINAIKYYNGNKDSRESLRLLQDLETKWYDSLKINEPAYSVYNDEYFLFDLWACWVVYSRNYLLMFKAKKNSNESIIESVGKANAVVDLGCGFGYTTAALKELFPTAMVYGTNIENTYQYNIANDFGELYDFKVVSNVQKINKKIDLIFASEYFEHFENPVEHLLDILSVCKPKHLVIANSFNSISIGHFKKYIHNQESFDGGSISRLFNKTLRNNGYIKVKTNFWNNRPTYWKKIE